MLLRSLRHLSALAALAAFPACSLAGERLATGMCPEGEECFERCPPGESCSTPVDGLYFAGTTPQLHQLDTMAVGGTQRMRAVTDVSLDAPAYGDPFVAVSTAPEVIAIDEVSPPELTLRAVAPGSAYARVLEPTTGLLIDRIEIRAAVATRLVVADTWLALFGIFADEDWAGYAGGTAPVHVAAASDAGELLWDDDMRLVEHPEALPGSGLFTGIPVDLTFPASGSLTLTMEIAGGTLSSDVPVVDHADALELVVLGGTPESPLEAERGELLDVCAVARNEGRALLGAPIEIAASGSVSTMPSDGTLPRRACVRLEAVSLGSGEVVASLDGLTATLAIEVSMPTATGVSTASLSSRMPDARAIERSLRASAGDRRRGR